MPDPVIYLDHAATTPMRPGVWEAMAPFAAQTFGNASGGHGAARRAKEALEDARERVAAAIGARPLEVVFTAGGTEADNLAVKGAVLAGGERRGVVTTAIEHAAVLDSARFVATLGCPLAVVGVDRAGVADPAEVADAVSAETGLVSVMAANNEVGARQPVRKIADEAKAAGAVLVHTDAVQAVVSEPLDVEDLGVDLMSIAAHKFGGPKGVGALYVRRGVRLEPVMHGGGHELGRRSGTQNVMGAVGMAVAMEVAVTDRDRFRRDVAEARDRFEAGLSGATPEIVVNAAQERLVQHSHIRFPGVPNDLLLIALDRAGVAASAASACQSGAATTSHVLSAMGMSDAQAGECLRFSFGWSSILAEADEAAGRVASAVASLDLTS
ncbi:MAG TPA: cysteine desulfurase family protein [Acidimicrobiia bacterium]|jgi:cysteine desulfurase|nr:cysteine desulfurase family protein [Acidimicrobiia bacterium]